MCGRVAQVQPAAALAAAFQAELLPERQYEQAARYNVPPSQPVLAVVARDGRRFVTQHRWGLVPAWAKVPAQFAARTNNARAETVAEKPAFRDSFRKRRSIIPVTAFYEWRRTGGPKQPHAIVRRDGGLLALAGLWASWQPASGDGAERLLTCAVVTTGANQAVGELHDRMPVVLPEEAWDLWLDPSVQDVERLTSLLKPCPSEWLSIYPVDYRVNSAYNDGPDLLEPLDARSPQAAV